VKGQWRYLYRAVDQQGQTVDFLMSKNRDKAAAVCFFKKAIAKAEGVLPAQTLVRTNKYLNNLIEQDHRKVKQRYYPMLGFKTFGHAQVTLSGIELANKIKKGQFDISVITGPGAMILQVWEAVLAT
jgi:transposase-like protein